MIVIDASVAVKWFVLEDLRNEALEVLQQIKKNPTNFAVPDFFFLEMTSVLLRLVDDESQIELIISDLFNLGLLQIRLGEKLLAAAANLGFQNEISGYDALYAACAISLKGTWLTADSRAHKKLAKLGISKVLSGS